MNNTDEQAKGYSRTIYMSNVDEVPTFRQGPEPQHSECEDVVDAQWCMHIVEVVVKLRKEVGQLLELCGAEKTVEGAQVWMQAEADLQQLREKELNDRLIARTAAFLKRQGEHVAYIYQLESQLTKAARAFDEHYMHHVKKGSGDKAQANETLRDECLSAISKLHATPFHTELPDGWWMPEPGTLKMVLCKSFEHAMQKYFEGFNIPREVRGGLMESLEVAHERVREYLKV